MDRRRGGVEPARRASRARARGGTTAPVLSAFLLSVLMTTVLAACAENPLKVYLTRTSGFEGQIYVSVETGSDDNRGTVAEPLKTIRAGIERGKWYLDQGVATAVEVRVAAGTYEQLDAAGSSVKLVEGVSLYGGYAPDFSVRDPSAHVSLIVDTSTSGEDVAAVRAEDGITRDTTIDGFTMVGGDCDEGGIARAMHVDRASPTISNNVIRAGGERAAAARNALDIYRDSDPVVRGNTIIGGSADGWQAALAVSLNSLAEIYENSIDAGESGTCNGVLFWETRSTFSNNTVSGGLGTRTYGVSVTSDSSVTLTNNTIDTGTGSESSVGIDVQDGSFAAITGNTIAAEDPDGTGKVRGISVDGGATADVSANSIVIESAHSAVGLELTGARSRLVGIVGNTVVIQEVRRDAVAISISDSECSVQNNLVFGGVCETAGGDYGTEGVVVEGGADAAIRNNTICGGCANSTAGHVFAVSIHESAPSIDNNIIFTCGGENQKAIHEHDPDGYAERLRNNLFYRYDAGMTLYFDWEDNGGADPASGLEDVGPLEGELTDDGHVAENNLLDDPVFVDLLGPDGKIETLDDNDWRLSPSTPQSVYEGGYDLSDEFDDDIDGAARAGLWSIGAYEYDRP